MTYQQAGRIAVLKRILGWVVFIPAVISTLISVLKFMYEHSEKKTGHRRGDDGLCSCDDRDDAL